jgi:hypothetical protein
MTLTLCVILFVNAGWNVIVWPMFLRRVLRDDRARNEHGRFTPFAIVHIVLVTIALVLAVVSATVGVLGLVLPA